MKGTSKVIMGATLVMVVTLAIVLGLVMVLLVELYCSLLLRRRKELRTTTSADIPSGNANNSSQQPQNQSETPSLSSFGVLRAPRSLLFPAVSGKDKVDIEKENPQPPQISESQTQKPVSTSHQFKILYASPPSPPLISVTSSQSVHKVPTQGGGGASTSSNGVCGDCKENLIYISNPMYDNEASQQSSVDTPFGTPDSSPSRLEMGGSSGDDDDDDDDITSVPITPPLSPMKKLPAEACSVSLREARSLATSGSDSNSNNGLSSSSSGSPSTSPSW